MYATIVRGYELLTFNFSSFSTIVVKIIFKLLLLISPVPIVLLLLLLSVAFDGTVTAALLDEVLDSLPDEEEVEEEDESSISFGDS